jgi:hypothetical protein
VAKRSATPLLSARRGFETSTRLLRSKAPSTLRSAGAVQDAAEFLALSWEELSDMLKRFTLEPERGIDAASALPGLGTSKRHECRAPDIWVQGKKCRWVSWGRTLGN